MSCLRVTALFCLAIAAALGGGESNVQAGEPFFYYPAYGAHRGKIKYRDGLLVDKQKIRWGGGITANGAAVFHDLFAAAVPIAQSFAGGGREAEDCGLPPEEFSRLRGIEEDKLAQAEALLEQMVALRRAFGVPDGAVAPTPTPQVETPTTHASAINDNFSNWDSSLSHAPTPSAAAPSNPVLPTPPAPAAGKVDDFKDWEKN